MTEQTFNNIADNSSINLEIPTENSFIRRSIPNKLDLLIVPRTTLLTEDEAYQSTTDDIDKDQPIVLSDTDSFDDENDPIMSDSTYGLSTVTSSGYGLVSCPVCFEMSILQSASCCEFRCCGSCWRQHISSTINDGRIKIPCASSDCNKFLTREIIGNLIRYDSILHERYSKLYINANQNPRAKTCPRCSHLYSLDTQSIINSKNSKISNKKLPKQVQCSECSLVWCFRCSAPWHENFTCKQFLKGDKLLLKWIKEKNEDQWNARKCPKCTLVIQRNGGCPHMTCSSCSCEFCYLCGRRYMKIPLVGQHHSKFSIFGCPYNLHPEKPWLRRTIRGTIATGVVVASPLIAVGALTAAVTVLPTIGIYRLVKHVRTRRRARATIHSGLIEQQLELDDDMDIQIAMQETDLSDETDDQSDSIIHLRELFRVEGANLTTDDDFQLSIFADMDVEHLFIEDERTAKDLQTCSIIPVIDIKDEEANVNQSNDDQYVIKSSPV